MKMRKRIAALIAVAMIAALMPMSAFAKSDNSVDRVVSYAKDTKLGEDVEAPKLKIELDDELTTGQAFYLELENAEWLGDDGVVAFVTDAKATKIGSKTLKVEGPANGDIIIPLNTKLTGGEATVEIDPEGTVVSASKHIFANSSSDGKAVVTIGDADLFVDVGSVADITLEEPYAKAFASATSDADTTKREVRLELRDSDFEFVGARGATVDGATIEKLRGLDVAIGSGSVRIDANDKGVAIITLPDTSAATQRGGFKIKGLKVRKADRNAAKGEIRATLRGEVIDGTKNIVIAKYGDYETKLELVEEDGYEVETGKFVDVEFKLSEGIANALLQNRAITFEFSEGVKIADLKIKANDKANDYEEDYDDNDITSAINNREGHNSFTINKLGGRDDDSEKVEYTFKAKLAVPNAFDGKEIKLVAEGRALSAKHELVAAKVIKAIEVEVEPIDIKVGLQNQVGGKIVIKENAKEAILKNYKDINDNSVSNAEIIIEIGDDSNNRDGLRITDADIEVTEGDLVLDLDRKVINAGAIIIPVKRQSTEASTIEITNIEITANRMVPEGKYNLKVGGEALTKNASARQFIDDRAFDKDRYNVSVWNAVTSRYETEERFLDPIVVKDFINITTKNPEDLTPGSGAKEVSFVIGNNKFIADGKEIEMDAAPYIKEGRTMVPVRYLAIALGIKEDAIKFDAGLVTIFKADGTILQVRVGSKDLVANGMTIPMVAAAEIIEGRTYVPVTEIGLMFGVSGSWDSATQTATFK